MRTTHVLIVTMMVLCGCSDDGAQAPTFDPDTDASRELIAKAASIPNADFEAFTTAATPPGESDIQRIGEPLSIVLMIYLITDSDDFRVIARDTVSPNTMTAAMWKSRARGYASVIQPEYIRSCEMSAAGDGDAKGVVTFAAEGLYSGKVEFTARHEEGSWKIVEFRLPAARSRTVLGEDGKWKVVK